MLHRRPTRSHNTHLNTGTEVTIKGFDFGSFVPNFGAMSVPAMRPPSFASFGPSNFWPSNSNGFDNQQYPVQASSYPPYGYNRIRREGMSAPQPYSSGQGFGYSPNGYNSFGQHKNHNYGSGQSMGPQPKVESDVPFDDFGGLDGFLGK